MKIQSKIIAAVITLALLSSTLNAQQIGIIAGLTANKTLETIKGSSIVNGGTTTQSPAYNYAPNYFVGLNTAFELNQKNSIKAELLYFRRSSKLKDSNLPAYSLQNISLPVLYAYRLSDKLSMEAGPQGDYLFNKSIGVQKRLNFSGNIGILFKPMPAIGIGVRYNHSLLTQVAKQYQSNYKLLNSTGIIYLQYLFNKK